MPATSHSGHRLPSHFLSLFERDRIVRYTKMWSGKKHSCNISWKETGQWLHSLYVISLSISFLVFLSFLPCPFQSHFSITVNVNLQWFSIDSTWLDSVFCRRESASKSLPMSFPTTFIHSWLFVSCSDDDDFQQQHQQQHRNLLGMDQLTLRGSSDGVISHNDYNHLQGEQQHLQIHGHHYQQHDVMHHHHHVQQQSYAGDVVPSLTSLKDGSIGPEVTGMTTEGLEDLIESGGLDSTTTGLLLGVLTGSALWIALICLFKLLEVVNSFSHIRHGWCLISETSTSGRGSVTCPSALHSSSTTGISWTCSMAIVSKWPLKSSAWTRMNPDPLEIPSITGAVEDDMIPKHRSVGRRKAMVRWGWFSRRAEDTTNHSDRVSLSCWRI